MHNVIEKCSFATFWFLLHNIVVLAEMKSENTGFATEGNANFYKLNPFAYM